jgi:hypothetical protein
MNSDDPPSRLVKAGLARHFSMYVCRLYISAVSMDIDNPGVTWDLDKPARHNVSDWNPHDQIQPPP